MINSNEYLSRNFANKSLFNNIEIDPRIKNYWLISGGPFKVGLILLTYLLFVKIIGPQLMKDRQAFRLKKLMIVYNLTLVLINAYFFVKSIFDSNFGLVLFETQYPTADDFSAETLAKINVCYMYWISKFFDLFDTVFLVLLKKYSNITFLHVYHHVLVTLLGWAASIGRVTVPAIYLSMFINSLVHVLMYSYYTISVFGKSFKKYLWFKIYITQLQIGQFAIYAIYGIVLVNFQRGYPMTLLWIVYSNVFLFLLMFCNFYRNAYQKSEIKMT
jgi:hypothetical protein